MARVLLIDNLDSFAYNIADLLHRVLGQPPTIWPHDHLADDLLSFDAIVVGPGPGRPQHAADMGLSDLALRQRVVPVLGVCLGHQGMALLVGEAVTELATPVHGQVSAVEHDGTGLFEGIPSPFDVVRYHSLAVTVGESSPLRVTAWSTDDKVVMALHEPGARRWGVQFHPESVLSEHGELVVANFLRMAGVQPAAAAPCGVAMGDVHRPLSTRSANGRAVAVETVVLGKEVDAWALHQSLLANSPTAFWLDASGAGSAPGRCSVMGDASGPLSYVLTHQVGTGDASTGAGAVTELSTGERLAGELLPNLAQLRDRLRVTEAAELPGTFRPGFVGYLGYELKAELGGSAAHDSPHPDARLVMADRAVVLDHEEGTAHAVYLWDAKTQAEQEAWVETARAAVQGQHRLGETSAHRPAARALHGGSDGSREGSMQVDAEDRRGAEGGLDACGGATVRHTQAQYLELIAECQRQIRAGESYEICLTNTATWRGRVDETALAAAMRQASPVPFAAWLRGPGPTVLSASPERFVCVSVDGVVEARPIKGTRPRAADPLADAALVEDLRTCVKERAENLMIVDLLRHDLHGVCRSGSVHVPSIFAVETYATVHQLVSTVRGRLAEGMDCLDVISTCFPGGSMTGAPKVRTMQILDRLEGGPRGVYAGALGWIGLDGAMDLSIVIRTVTLTDGIAEFGVGGAITALSDPAEEYAETQVKAAALTRALAAATE